MVRNTLLAPLALLATTAAVPALAQQETSASHQQSAEPAPAAEELDPFAMLGGLFAVEPLTADQEARLPQANAIIAKLIPEGAMAEMMGSMFDKFIKPLGDLPKTSAATRAAQGIGYEEGDLELTEEQAKEIADMLDPAFEEREAREMALMPEMMATMMNAMEPPMRKAMAELYAINFTAAELSDIDAFFSTPSGATYARKSFTMASDPRVMAATFEAMPAMMGPISQMEERVKAATADLPPVRGYAELTAAERARITALTGLTAAEIEEALAAQEGWTAEAATTPSAAADEDHVH
ncbi:DUF2059 domain-containing protein [Parerythrobacter aurantius]|uniref:DUF2059 domain-containing protein n=1 Tax=Parerythrobacter aurantius TaxID=3127706 RepID=UPI00324766AF